MKCWLKSSLVYAIRPPMGKEALIHLQATKCLLRSFKTYHLGLPARSPRLSQLKFDAIAARLQSFRDRASYVQDLALRFGKTDDQDVDDLFPSRAMPYREWKQS